MTNAEFEQIIAEHAKWLANKDQGRPAYVRGQDLTKFRPQRKFARSYEASNRTKGNLQ